MMALAISALLAGTAGAAHAQSVVALLDGNMLAVVDVKAMKAGAPMKVSGVDGKLVGIDVRPADGMLYGLFEDGTVATIDTKSGAAMKKSKLDTMLPMGTMATVDFNPVADRLRVIGSDGTNLRANVDDGKVTKDGSLKFAETDMHKGETPKIVAGAYTNSMKGAKETALFDVDATIGALVKQAPPNDGVLTAVGKFGITAPSYAFDIAAGDGGTNDGWLMAGDTLYKVDLTSGKATAAGKVAGVSGKVHDIAILPAM
ncbi:lipoprotein [Azorhizobium oxalatiphilum]|uniref:Lipoprotein n=2 Tax=Azorhizobium oxalatiphilum TaxID=980631 RepID=A0A917FHS0_9HYPH|nr:lipoprotein [Azorhizobium oxalatiphilum]